MGESHTLINNSILVRDIIDRMYIFADRESAELVSHEISFVCPALIASGELDSVLLFTRGLPLFTVELEIRGISVPSVRKAAAKLISDSATRRWLLWDEQGTWERRIKYLEYATVLRAQELGLSTSEVEHQIGMLIAAEALEAMAEHLRNEPMNKRKRDQERELVKQEAENRALRFVDPRSANKWVG